MRPEQPIAPFFSGLLRERAKPGKTPDDCLVVVPIESRFGGYSPAPLGSIGPTCDGLLGQCYAALCRVHLERRPTERTSLTHWEVARVVVRVVCRLPPLVVGTSALLL